MPCPVDGLVPDRCWCRARGQRDPARGSPFSVRMLVSTQPGQLEVSDHGDGVPARRRYGTGTTTGNGLAIVDGMSDRWGVEQLDGTKTVWCEVDL
jgi:hypothetical protein